MIEGIVVANYLEDSKADLARSALWLAIDGESEEGEASTLTLRTEVAETAPAPLVPTKAAAA